jgi:hypothetical protein
LGLALVLSFPTLYRAYRAGRVFTGLFGVREGIEDGGYASVPTITRKTVLAKERRRPLATLTPFLSFFLWSPLGVGLNVGQGASSESRLLPLVLTFMLPVVIVVLYFVTILVCTLTHAPLISNSNRAGKCSMCISFI